MSWVSKREDDQESLDFGRALAALAPIPTSKRDVERTRLKIEIENLRRFEQIAEYLLKQAKAQIAQLKLANEKLRDQLITAEERRLEDLRRIGKRLSQIEDIKSKQANEQIRKLKLRHAEEEDELREQAQRISQKQAMQEEKMQAALDDRTSKLERLETMLREFRFTAFKEMLLKSEEPNFASKFGESAVPKSKSAKSKPVASRSFGTTVLPPDLQLE